MPVVVPVRLAVAGSEVRVRRVVAGRFQDHRWPDAVAAQALRFNASLKHVRLASDGEQVVARQVKTGIQSDTHIEVQEGLGDDDEVVIGNYRAISRDLQDGSAVMVGGEKKG